MLDIKGIDMDLLSEVRKNGELRTAFEIQGEQIEVWIYKGKKYRISFEEMEINF